MSSWKKYGGINKLDNFNNLTVNALIADYFVLRNPYKGNWDISGDLTVYGKSVFNADVSLNGNLRILNDLKVDGNLIVNASKMDGDTAIGGNLIVAKLLMLKDNITGVVLSSSGDPFSLGINIVDPRTTLDIFTGYQEQTVDIHTDLSINRNTIARNQYNQSIQTYIDPSSASIDFYIDTPYTDDPNNTTTSQIPDGRIILKPAGIIELDVSSEFHIRPRVMISSDITKSFIDDEKLMIVSDPNTTTTYLPNIYDFPEFKTATSTIHVAPDSSSVQFIRFSDETTGRGVAMGGGIYPLLANTQIGTLGITTSNAHNDYIPAIQYQSTTPYQHKRVSVGINKYTNQYPYTNVFEVNGPSRISYGEVLPITITGSSNPNTFEGTIEGYLIHLSTIYAYGPSIEESGFYKPVIYSSTDNGYTWTKNIVNITDIPVQFKITSIKYLSSLSKYLIYGYATGANSPLYRSATDLLDGTTWEVGAITNGLNQMPISIVSTIEYNDPSSNNIQLSTAFSYGTQSFIYDPISTYQLINASGQTPNNRLNTSSKLSSITGITETKNFLFVCGQNGIIRYLKSAYSPYDPMYTNPQQIDGTSYYPSYPNPIGNPNNYKSLDSYFSDSSRNNNYWIVAVGTSGIISSLSQGSTNESRTDLALSANWTHHNISNTSTTTWNKVKIYDEMNAIAIGYDTTLAKSIIAYTTDRGTTWKTNRNAIDEIGIPVVKTNFTNILPLSDTEFIMSSPTINPLSTNAYHAEMPTIWKRNEYTVLNVDGRTTATGDIFLNGASINSEDSTVTIYPSTTTSQINIGNSTATTNLVQIQKDFQVLNDASFNRNAFVASTLTVSGNIIGLSDLSLNGRAYIQNDVSMNRNAWLASTLTVSGNMIGLSDLSLNGRAYIQNDVSMNRNAWIASTLTVSGNMIAMSDLSLNGKAYIQNDVSMNRNAWIASTLTASGNIIGLSDLSLNGKAYIQNDVSLNRNAWIASTLTASGNIIGLSDLSLNGNAYIQNDVSLNRNAWIASTLTVSGNIIGLSDISLNGRAYIQNDVSMNRNAWIASTLTASGNIIGLSDISLNGKAYIQNDVSMNRNAWVASTLTVSGNMIALSDLSLNGNAYIQNDVSMNANAWIASTLTASGNIIGLSDLSLNGNAYIQNDVSMNRNAWIASTLTASGNIIALSDLSLNGRAYVQNDVSLNSNLYVKNATTFGGNVTIMPGAYIYQW